jgi:hypothetical protein
MYKRPYPKLLLLIVLLIALILLIGYHLASAVEITQSMAAKGAAYSPRVLLATQRSAYKNALVEGVIKGLKKTSG